MTVASDVAVVAPRAAFDRRKAFSFLQDNGVYLALLLLVAYNVVFTRYWTQFSNIRLQFVAVAPVLILALGMALVIGTEGIDLSVGATMAVAASVIGQSFDRGLSAPVVILLVLLSGAIVGSVSGSLVAHFEVQPIVATLALLVAGRGIAALAQAHTLSITDETLLTLGTGEFLGIQAPFWDALVPLLLVAFIVRKTLFGRRIVAIGDNVRASYLSGIPVRRTLVLVYIVSGLLASWAGLVQAARTGTNNPTDIGVGYELFAITAVVVGGTPLSGGRVRIFGTVAGALVMQLISSTLISHGIRDSITRISTGVIIVLAVYVQQKRGRS